MVTEESPRVEGEDSEEEYPPTPWHLKLLLLGLVLYLLYRLVQFLIWAGAQVF